MFLPTRPLFPAFPCRALAAFSLSPSLTVFALLFSEVISVHLFCVFPMIWARATAAFLGRTLTINQRWRHLQGRDRGCLQRRGRRRLAPGRLRAVSHQMRLVRVVTANLERHLGCRFCLCFSFWRCICLGKKARRISGLLLLSWFRFLVALMSMHEICMEA